MQGTKLSNYTQFCITHIFKRITLFTLFQGKVRSAKSKGQADSSMQRQRKISKQRHKEKAKSARGKEQLWFYYSKSAAISSLVIALNGLFEFINLSARALLRSLSNCIFSSIEFSVINRYTNTFLSWPIRWARLIA